VKYITIALVLAASLVFATAPPIGASQGKFAVGALHATAACTINLGGFLFGADNARFFWQGDTLKDTVSYYFAAVQVQPFIGSAWSASIGMGAANDSMTMNHESGTTTSQYSTDTTATGGKLFSRIGMMPYSRVILTPSAGVATQGVKNCTLWVTRFKH